MKRLAWIALAVMVLYLNPLTTSCFFTEECEPLECKVIELKENLFSQYYDAIVRVEFLNLDQAVESRLTLVTPTSSYELKDLTYIDIIRITNNDAFNAALSELDRAITDIRRAQQLDRENTQIQEQIEQANDLLNHLDPNRVTTSINNIPA